MSYNNYDNYGNYDHYDHHDNYGLPRGFVLPAPQQPAIPQQSQFLPNYYVPAAQRLVLHDAYLTQNNVHTTQTNAYRPQNDAYPAQINAHPAQNVDLAHDPGPAPVLRVPAPKPTRKQPGNGSKEPTELKYSARDLLDIVQTAIKVLFFTAKHGEKGKKLIEFGNAVRALGIKGSDAVLKARLLEVLTFHEDPAHAPPAIIKAIEGTTYEITLGAPLDLLAAQRREYADKTDAEKEKLLQKAAEDKRGGEAIRNASLNKSRRTAAALKAQENNDDDEVVLVEPSTPRPVVSHAPLTPAIPPLRALSPAGSWSPPRPVNLLHKCDSDDDSDLEIISHTLPLRESTTQHVVVKAEPVPPTLPPASTTKPVAGNHVKIETPMASIPSRKASSSKHIKAEDSDIENSPPTARKTKRVRRNTSFDMQTFLLEERKLRGEFETNLLDHVRQGNTEFRKVAENTQTFHRDFLGLLRGVFPEKD
ncbi:hypothetical protein DFH08DRAFT_1001279 [Mycena albidolilacea]|uniref:Uncharacterized protein n=1 Tax=Mycena albidolilacea TaxID=1033008 RepID=A0AAD7ETA0_9AGAR|nr:hypothetical protein DFH08DRAFT_1001279 [Mycena albidolilacea]